MSHFKLDGPLPSSTLLLEASAGTGKTYTIAALAVRYIVERRLDVGELLLITFSNNAATELRARVFAAIERCARALRGHLDGTPIPDDEPVALHLAGLGDVDDAVARLEHALDVFDRATILTTHAFCQQSLERLGILGDADHAEQLSQAESLVDECAADVYLSMFQAEERAPIDAKRAFDIARKACGTTLPLAPEGSPEVEFATRVRGEFAERKRRRGLVTFDDLITRMRDVLRSHVTGPAARDWLRDAYKVVLIDEFQDTDPEQWAVVREAFVAPDRPTILIGDPKQSIYGFRNADIMSYLDAQRIATVATLGTNHRSDAGIVDGVVDLMQGLEMGAETIQVTPVTARHGSRMDDPVPQRVRIRQVTGVDRADDVILDDLVAQIDACLELTLDGRPSTASDITVLVRATKTAAKVTARLNELGYPAVQFGGTNVWEQPAAADWRRFLRALSPSASGARRVVALTDLVGATVTGLMSTDESTRLTDMLRRAEEALALEGPSAALDVVREETRLEARIVPTPGGERYIADLAHIGELLDASGHRDPLALLRFVDEAARLDSDTDLRVVSDAPAIRVMTLHAAKGLEFPIVLLPDMSPLRIFLMFPFNIVLDGKRHLWLRKETEDSDIGDRAAWQAREEELRLLYVGLTRAKHLAIAWHADEPRSRRGPVSAALLRLRSERKLLPAYPWALAPTLDHVLVEQVTPATPPRNHRTVERPPLTLATLTRTIDQEWRRTSYTGLTSGLHDVPAGADEHLEVETLIVDEALSEPAPMGDLPAGAAFGTLVHEALEVLDWTPAGLHDRVVALVAEQALSFDDAQRAALAVGIESLVTTPLAPLTTQSLSDIPTSLRLPELDFDLPLASSSGATLAELAALMARHLPADDLLADYPRRLLASEAASKRLTGLLTGSIDAVLQTDADRYLVVDYKTNRLAPSPDDVLTVGHYTPRAMAEAMMDAHYPLQAILYCAALHRFLGLRLPGYRPEQHLGGVGYLFVRGMAGPTTPEVDGNRCGVFAWHPSPELVVAVSELLGGHDA